MCKLLRKKGVLRHKNTTVVKDLLNTVLKEKTIGNTIKILFLLTMTTEMRIFTKSEPKKDNVLDTHLENDTIKKLTLNVNQ